MTDKTNTQAVEAARPEPTNITEAAQRWFADCNSAWALRGIPPMTPEQTLLADRAFEGGFRAALKISAALTLPQEVAAEVQTFDQWWSEIENFAMRGERLCDLLSKPSLAQVAYDEGVAAASRSQAPAGVAGGVDASRERGQLDPRVATAAARQILNYVDSFNGQTFSPTFDNVDRQNLAVALDHLTEAGAMILNLAERVAATQAQPSPHPAGGGSGGVTEPEKCYSTNNEDFNHDSLWEAMEEIEGNDGLEPGRVVYEANANRRTAGYYFDIDHMFEQMGEHAHDHGGEYADDFPDVAPHKKAELGKLIYDWLNANVKVNFYTVSNRKEITITEEMIAEHRSDPAPEQGRAVDVDYQQQNDELTRLGRSVGK